MSNTGSRNESFIVRIWFERREIENAPPEIRGVVEHVKTGNKHYFRDVNDILKLVLSYLETFGGPGENQT